jgi:hypothetical protein
VRLPVSLASLETLHGVGGVDNARQAVSRLVLDDGLARGLAKTSDGEFHTGLLSLQSEVGYTDRLGQLRVAGVGSAGMETTQFKHRHGTNQFIRVPDHFVGSLDMQNNVPSRQIREYQDPSKPTFTFGLFSDSGVDVGYRSRLGEVDSIFGPDGMLEFH